MTGPGIGREGQVSPAPPLIAHRVSFEGGEGKGTGVTIEDFDMGSTGSAGVAPAHVGSDGRCG